MLIIHPLTSDPSVVLRILFGQRMFFTSLLWELTIGVQLQNTRVASVSLEFEAGMEFQL